MNYNTLMVKVPTSTLKESGKIWDIIYDRFKDKLVTLNLEYLDKVNEVCGVPNDPIYRANNQMRIRDKVESMGVYRVEIKHEDLENDMTTLAVAIHATPDTLAHYQWGDGE